MVPGAAVAAAASLAGADERIAQRRIQEALTDDMVTLAAGIKANALAMQGAIRDGGATLDQAAELLDRNAADAKKTAGTATTVLAAARRSSWLSWGLLFLVGLVFAWVYLLIKMTAGTAGRTASARAASAEL